jgi:hypothetical protein
MKKHNKLKRLSKLKNLKSRKKSAKEKLREKDSINPFSLETQLNTISQKTKVPEKAEDLTKDKKEDSIFKEPKTHHDDEKGPASKFFDVKRLKQHALNFFERFKDKPIKTIEEEKKIKNTEPATIVELSKNDEEVSKKKAIRREKVDIDELSKGSSNQEDLWAQSDTPEEAVGRSIDTLTKPQNIKHFTELADNEIRALSALVAANEVLKIKTLTTFINEFDNRRVSLNRKGRTEIADLGKASMMPFGANKAEGLISKFMK